MTDEEIIELAEKTRKEEYCDKYNDGKSVCGMNGISCKDKNCPLFYSIDGWYDACIDIKDYYKNSFLDGFRAAMEYISRSNRTII